MFTPKKVSKFAEYADHFGTNIFKQGAMASCEEKNREEIEEPNVSKFSAVVLENDILECTHD